MVGGSSTEDTQMVTVSDSLDCRGRGKGRVPLHHKRYRADKPKKQKVDEEKKAKTNEGPKPFNGTLEVEAR